MPAQQNSEEDIFARQPLVEIRGIVDPRGVTAGQMPGEQYWTLTLTFDGWRAAKGPIKTARALVWRLVTDDEFKQFRAKIPPESIIRIQGRVAEQNESGRPQILLEEFHSLDSSDSELNNLLLDLQKPVFHDDPFFGRFTFDRSLTMYSADVVWNQTPANLTLWLDDRSELEATIGIARQLWSESVMWDQRVKDRIAEELLPLKSQNWQEDEGSDVSREQFESRMELSHFTIRPDATFEITYEDGDLFFGHQIVVFCSFARGAYSAGIQG